MCAPPPIILAPRPTIIPYCLLFYLLIQADKPARKKKKKPLVPENADATNPGGLNFLKKIIIGQLEEDW
jgi:hypothetical protein